MLPTRILRLATALVLLAAASTGQGKTSQELVSDLRIALKNVSASVSDRQNEESLRQLSLSLLPDPSGANADNRFQNNVQLLTQLSTQTKSDRVRQICQDLIRQLGTEKEQRESVLTGTADEVVKRTGEAALAARGEKDLEATAQEISRVLERQGEPASDTGRRAFEKLRAAKSFVSRWQNYLTLTANGNAEAALQLLNQMASDTAYPMVPRAELLSRVQALKEAKANLVDASRAPVLAKIDAICRQLKDPANIGVALEQMRNLKQQFPNEVNSGVLSELESLEVTYKQIRAGVDTFINLPSSSRLTDLRLNLFMLTLPRKLAVPADLRPKPEETPGDYLDRVKASAKQARNWPLLLRAVEAPRSLGSSFMANEGASIALKAFIVAQNEEQAGQYASAVVSYQKALADVNDLVPMSVVRDRLMALKQEHLPDYEAGMQRALATPLPKFTLGNQPGLPTPVPGTAGGVPTPRATATGSPGGVRPQPTPLPGYRRSSPPPGQ